jgi:hypothetical protein
MDEQLNPHNALRSIHEGMEVYDAEGRKVGAVGYVQFGREDMSQRDLDATVTPNFNDPVNRPYVPPLLELEPEDDASIPQELQDTLVNSGYIRINGGLFKNDCFATPDQIAQVHEGHVHLSVEGEQLIRL